MKRVFLLLGLFVNLSGFAADMYFPDELICKAGIAIVMGRDPAIMNTDKVVQGIYFISYVRDDDGKKWDYKCKVVGSRIIWGMPTGRWRDGPYDSKVVFKVQGKRLMLEDRHLDGSVTTKQYSLKDFE